MDALVEGVDHVYVPMREADAAFAVLSEELDLPALWPFTSFGEFASGGVSLGSIKLEVLEANPRTPWSRAHEPPRIQAVALRPARAVYDGFLAELDSRGVHRTAPEEFEPADRSGWTNVYFPDLVGEDAGVFVCDYHAPGPRDLVRRRRLLAERQGGRLGVLDAVEVVISARDAASARDRWQRLLGPVPSGHPWTWRLTTGPVVTLVEGVEDGVAELVVAVRSVGDARRRWRGLAGPLDGLPLAFVPAPDPDAPSPRAGPGEGWVSGC
ncbi:MAG TPA: hypothetical protein VFM09_06230 [Marmoricola sp.]|nr:hypothetical protein [Marmoricola sp.]